MALVCPLLLSLVFVAGCRSTGADVAAGEEAVVLPAVEAVPARSGTLPLVERLSGVTRAANQVQLRPEISGIVAEVFVQSGAAVRRGDPLVRLRDETQRERLEQAEAAVRLAEASARQADARVAELTSQVVRLRALADAQLVSSLELETREAQLAAARASAASERARVEQELATVDERRAEVERTVVRAPIDGRVGRRNVEVGMRVDPGTLLFVLGDLDRLMVEVPLTEAMLAYIREGLPVRVMPRTGVAEPLEATLSRISPFLAEGSFSTVGEIDIANDAGTLRPGMFVSVDVRYGESERAPLVPASALWEDPQSGEAFLFVVSPGAEEAVVLAQSGELSADGVPVERRPGEIIARGRASVAVRGVAHGEWVVTVGQHLLAAEGVDQARVRLTTWERVMELQSLQREDLLASFLDKQRRVARERGAMPPSNQDYVGGATAAAPSR
jgi:RND family efflux transporter MFP subunit